MTQKGQKLYVSVHTHTHTGRAICPKLSERPVVGFHEEHAEYAAPRESGRRHGTRACISGCSGPATCCCPRAAIYIVVVFFSFK